MTAVVLLIVPGARIGRARQQAVCLAYADEHQVDVAAVADTPEAAAAMLDSGEADVVLAASPALWSRGGVPARLRGRVRYARPTPPATRRRGVPDSDLRRATALLREALALLEGSAPARPARPRRRRR